MMVDFISIDNSRLLRKATSTMLHLHGFWILQTPKINNNIEKEKEYEKKSTNNIIYFIVGHDY